MEKTDKDFLEKLSPKTKQGVETFIEILPLFQLVYTEGKAQGVKEARGLLLNHLEQ